jgi:hypothetical protein
MLGIVSSVVAQLLWEVAGRKLLRHLRYRQGRYHVVPTGEMLRIGATTIPWLVIASGPWDPQRIHLSYTPRQVKPHPLVAHLYQDVRDEAAKLRASGRAAPFNGLGYQLEQFWVGGRTTQTEDRMLDLRFRPTDYFMMLATDQRLDSPIEFEGQTTTLRREFVIDKVSLDKQPVTQFATHWGIALQLISRDGFTLFSERGQTAVDAHVFFPSVAEGASRPADDDGTGAPDLFRTAIRGTAEEIGIELDRDEITWLSFGTNAVLCEYGMIGVAHSDFTADEMLRYRSVGLLKDRWESARLHSVRWEPGTVATFVESHGPWSPFALVTLYHSLLRDFTRGSVDRVFSKINIHVSQHLPQDSD